MGYKTEQEKFWTGEFGDEYIERNSSETYLASNISLFSKILKNCDKIDSIIELGPNIGMNLIAIESLLPNLKCAGVEINSKAAQQLRNNPIFKGNIDVTEGSILEYQCKEVYDASLIKGVLIHINPDMLDKVYDCLYKVSRKWIIMCEYYNPTPVTIPYRGNKDKLYKRDFAGEFMDKYKDVSLVDYGFVYHRDNLFPQDDITWFLMKKNG